MEPEDQKNESSLQPPPPPLSRNTISYLGWMVVLIAAAFLVVLIIADILFYQEKPYNSLITYVVFPGFLLAGAALVILGVLVEWRRRHRRAPHQYPALPVIDVNQKWQRRRLAIAVVLASVFFAVSAVAVYQGYHFTESPVFCGQICHQVMKPEYTAYQHSSHARVSCTECHIGPGAGWYVRSKMSGLRQVWVAATGTYHLPISTPVANLRPAQETCEHCHWPGKFSPSLERTIWHFSPDQANTPLRYNLLMKVGGGNPELGLGKGIHWHINPNIAIRYWARDHQRMDIPWVEVTEKGQEPRIFKTDDCPEDLPAEAEIRTMDCMDCHNRPSHVFQSPRLLINEAMATGALDRSLPYFKRYATQIFEGKYPTTDAALEAISQGLQERYKAYMQGARGKQLVQRNIELLQKLYQRDFFPEHKTDWRAFPDHRGHFELPGCYRCHDNEHKSVDNKTISMDCHLCHEIIDQAEGEAAFAPPAYQIRPFQHPRNLGDIWKDRHCTDCHGTYEAPGAKDVAQGEDNSRAEKQ